MSLIFIDTETTGLDPTRHCVWEIGMISDSGEYRWVLDLTDHERAAADPMALTVGRFYERTALVVEEWMKDGARRPLAPNNTVREDRKAALQDHMKGMNLIQPSDRMLLADFLAHETDKCHLIGAVPSFDARFVGELMQSHTYPPTWHYHLVDVEALAAGKLGWEPPWKSKDLYRELGIDPTYFDEHTALGDARMAKAVYEVVFGLPLSYPECLHSPDGEQKEKEPSLTVQE